MSFLYEKSAIWRWIVAASKASKAFYATFAGIYLVVPWMLGYAVMSTTNRSQIELNEELRRRARDDSLVLLLLYILLLWHILGSICFRHVLRSFGCLVNQGMFLMAVDKGVAQPYASDFHGLWWEILEAAGRVNKERVQQLLYEIEHKDDTEFRYVAALRGETLTGTVGARIRGGGGTSLQVSSATPPSNPATTQRGLNVADSKLPESSTS